MKWYEIHDLGLEMSGECSHCHRQIRYQAGNHGIPEHKIGKSNRRCRGSGYSSFSDKYIITSYEQATKLATLIVKDEGTCLGSYDRHSMACSDGRRCETTRLMLAQALAEYFLALPANISVSS